jgi:hypothetical protein
LGRLGSPWAPAAAQEEALQRPQPEVDEPAGADAGAAAAAAPVGPLDFVVAAMQQLLLPPPQHGTDPGDPARRCSTAAAAAAAAVGAAAADGDDEDSGDDGTDTDGGFDGPRQWRNETDAGDDDSAGDDDEAAAPSLRIGRSTTRRSSIRAIAAEGTAGLLHCSRCREANSTEEVNARRTKMKRRSSPRLMLRSCRASRRAGRQSTERGRPPPQQRQRQQEAGVGPTRAAAGTMPPQKGPFVPVTDKA